MFKIGSILRRRYTRDYWLVDEVVYLKNIKVAYYRSVLINRNLVLFDITEVNKAHYYFTLETDMFSRDTLWERFKNWYYGRL